MRCDGEEGLRVPLVVVQDFKELDPRLGTLRYLLGWRPVVDGPKMGATTHINAS